MNKKSLQNLKATSLKLSSLILFGLIVSVVPLQAAFEQIGAGARALGMGNAFSAMADDATAIHYNAAGLAQLRLGEVTAGYGKLYSGLKDDSAIGHGFVGAAQPLAKGRYGTLGAGWEQLDEDILGEFYLRMYLDQQLPKATVNRVATGWGGDRYAIYWNAAEEGLVMALRLVWDTPEDALEFAEAYPDYPAALYATAGEAQPDGTLCWAGDDAICFLQIDGESLVVRAPDITLALAVLAALQAA